MVSDALTGGGVPGFRKNVSMSLEIIIIYIIDKEVTILANKRNFERTRSTFVSNKIRTRKPQSLLGRK